MRGVRAFPNIHIVTILPAVEAIGVIERKEGEERGGGGGLRHTSRGMIHAMQPALQLGIP